MAYACSLSGQSYNKAGLIQKIYQGQTTVPEAVRHYDLVQKEIEKAVDGAEAGMKPSRSVRQTLVA